MFYALEEFHIVSKEGKLAQLWLTDNVNVSSFQNSVLYDAKGAIVSNNIKSIAPFQNTD